MAGSVFVFLWLAVAAQDVPVPADLFADSSRCIACHHQIVGTGGEEVPIAAGWRASMMANAARDPYWQAAVRRETLDHPAAAAAIEHECAACHMPMVRFPAHRSGRTTSVFASTTAPMAMDGVSCTVCHRISANRLGERESFNGGFDVDLARRGVAGPFEIDRGRMRVMQSASLFTPERADHLRSSMVCATCHTLYTHALAKDGTPAGELPEQTPFLEWRHSAWRGERSCQSCHMPEVAGEAPIVSVLGQPRPAVSRHEFRGGNAFMMRMLRTNAAALGVTAPAAELLASETRTIEYSESHAAKIAIEEASIRDGRLQLAVAVTNLAGHKLPTAYPSRRVWLHVAVRDERGAMLFESGGLRDDGSIAGNDNDADAARYEPHYTTIHAPDQVQIYETILADAEGSVTTGLISAVRYIKDNRLLPRGFDKSSATSDIAVRGDAASDPDFRDPGDRIRYEVDLGAAASACHVEVRLLYQPIAFRWADTLGAQKSAESARFATMYAAASSSSATVLARGSVDALAGNAADIVRVYGPGGPAPAMKEAAEAFRERTGIRVEVTAGPTDQWIRKAREDADLVFSGSENMMTSFIRTMGGAILEGTVRPIYIRPATILVRPGNPKQLAGFRDLMKPGIRVMVVEGAGQIGLWEDVAGRLGDINAIRMLRSNIVEFAKNSGEAKERWTNDPSVDAWLIYNIWEIANPAIADPVEIEPELRIWRDCGIALTRRGSAKAAAKNFAAFLESAAGRTIFEKWGWK